MLDSLLNSLPRDTATDLRELFSQLADEEDSQIRAEIGATIKELLLPQSLQVELLKEYEEEDPAIRERLGTYRKKVGQEIKRCRTKLKLTQALLAEKAGIPQSHVSRLECGVHVPTHATIERIAKALDTTPSRLDPGF